ncbi:MAG: N-acetyl-gamma-glutamyl-phosphate reductase [Oscillospiraceae bacterium]|nr:N-acetyl-gamma-glutamyl-phosphate reductase [Oscillospiraceae bacterium]
MTKVFIDGSVGTTGLRIFERLNERKDLSLITLSEEKRKDADARREAINSADIAFLCLPDAAAVEAVSFVENKNTAIIDTSTAHRTAPEFDYGFAELSGLREKIAKSKRVANPGCHASGFIALVEPLVKSGIISKSQRLDCVSLTGYSGGGKKMIAEYEGEDRSPLLSAPRMYGLSQSHKHLKEMKAICSLENAPSFCPIVAPFYSGMQVTVSLFRDEINGSLKTIQDCYREYYKSGLVSFCENADEDGFLSAAAYSGRDDMQVTVSGNEERIVLVSRFDNLGKGASGAAIQNMNILLGIDEKTGLVF